MIKNEPEIDSKEKNNHDPLNVVFEDGEQIIGIRLLLLTKL